MKILFSAMLVAILSVTLWASAESNVMAGFQYLFASRWGIATLFDTYFGFLTIYLWMAYKEPAPVKRVLWFFAVIGFGTIAISAFILHELRLRKGQGFEAILLRKR